MKQGTVFQRYEFKYLMTRGQQARLLSAAGDRLRPDEYSHSSIRNLYLDTPDFRLIRRSLEKPVYKEKLRLRSYGRADWEHPVFMELKKKYRSVVYKRRLTLPYGRALDCLAGDCPWPETQIGSEIGYAMDFYPDLEPRVFLSYERDSWYAPESGLRITFDDCLEYLDCHRFRSPWRPIIESSESVMEIKSAVPYPPWLVDVLSAERIYSASFTKYGNAYQMATAVPRARNHRRAMRGGA